MLLIGSVGWKCLLEICLGASLNKFVRSVSSNQIFDRIVSSFSFKTLSTTKMICLQITRSPFIWKSRHAHVGTLEIETTYWAFPVALLTTYYSRLNELIVFAFLIFITADPFLAVFVLFSNIFASDLCFFVSGLHSLR